jgi:hypothetical protein
VLDAPVVVGGGIAGVDIVHGVHHLHYAPVSEWGKPSGIRCGKAVLGKVLVVNGRSAEQVVLPTRVVYAIEGRSRFHLSYAPPPSQENAWLAAERVSQKHELSPPHPNICLFSPTRRNTAMVAAREWREYMLSPHPAVMAYF